VGSLQESNKAVIQRWIGPASDGIGPFLLSNEARELLAQDAVWHLPPTAVIPGLEDSRVVTGRENIFAIQQRAGEIYNVATIQIAVRNLLADGDWVILQYAMQCQAANGNDYRQEYLFLFELHDGVIATIWDYYDTLLVDQVVLGGLS
jgi:ketosteroid isomerase-like protein